MRKLVLMRGQDWLQAAAEAGSLAVAAGPLADIGVERSTWLPDAPIPLSFDVDRALAPETLQEEPGGFLVEIEVEDEEAAEEELRAKLGDDFGAVFSNPEIGLTPPICPNAAIGTAADVQLSTNLGPVHGAGHTGGGVRVAIVDEGVSGASVNVVGGWTPRAGVAPGTAHPNSHGTMCALDVTIAAPHAMVFDFPILSIRQGMIGLLSDAIRAFAELLAFLLNNPGPRVVSNSWAMFSRATDAPAGNPQNYSRNPAHPFNLITTALAQAGADVIFASGNCGATCPDQRCGTGDTGPGNSIFGANSHSEVLTVGAVTVHHDLLGYSSQGPGTLSSDKPDVTAPSHFNFPGAALPVHAGTSAACPVAAGIVAALRSKPSARGVAPAAIRDAVRQTASHPAGTGWDGDFGHGVIDAGRAWAQL